MDFALTGDQKELQHTVDRILQKLCPLDRVRKLAERRELIADDVWSGLGAAGVPGLLIPETHNGMGLDVLDAALVVEMLGRHVAPAPFVASVVMAPLAIMGAGSAVQKTAWLPKLAAGETIMGAAIAETVAGAREGAGVISSRGLLNGSALFVMDHVSANAFIVADKAGGLHIVDAGAPGLTRIMLTTIDVTRPVCELRFTNTPADTLPGDCGVALKRMRDVGRVMLAADTLGAAWRMIEMAVDYAKMRKQFGRVIGSFQAVKHMCAEMAAQLEPARSLVWYAGYAQDHDRAQATMMAAHAKAHLSEVGKFVARTATEVHGGMGITDLLGLHYWFKRIGANRQLLGSPERLRGEAARAQSLVA